MSSFYHINITRNQIITQLKMSIKKLTNIHNFDLKNILFSDPVTCPIPGGSLTYKRVNISVDHQDGNMGELLLKTERLFSYGISESKDKDGNVISHSLPLVFWGKEKRTELEKSFSDRLQAIVDRCADHIVENRLKFGKPKMTVDYLMDLGFNPIWYPKDKETKEIIDTLSPRLYPKFIVSKKNQQVSFITKFFDHKNRRIDEPLSLIGKRCYVDAVLKVESIFVGKEIKLQIKLFEARLYLIESQDPNAYLLCGSDAPLLQESTASSSSSASKRKNDDDDSNDSEMKSKQTKQTKPTFDIDESSSFIEKEEKEDKAGSLPTSDSEDVVMNTAAPAVPPAAPKIKVTRKINAKK
jgi:hypothetical protein